MQAYLFDDFRVEIDERAARPGHCWHGQYRDGIPLNVDSDLERFFYKLTLDYENPVVLDVGANNGVFSLIAAIHHGMRSYAFEPYALTYDILRRNVALNNLEDRVKTFQLALADRSGTAALKVPASGKGDGLACIGDPLRFTDWVEHKVPVSTVDEFVGQQGIERVDLVKIDTEGCELPVLRGAKELIARCRPGILLEYWEPNTRQFGYHPEEITKLLTSFGYEHTMVGHEDMHFYMPKTARAARATFGTKDTQTGARGGSESAEVCSGIDMAPRRLPRMLEEFSTGDRIDSVNEMRQWIERLASSQKRLYYRDQSPESLSTLVNLVRSHRPSKIVELGTLSGLSLRAWLLARSNAQIDAEIIAVDFSFKSLLGSCAVLPLELSNVRFLEQDILKTDFSRLWSKEDKVILYVDAHDTPRAAVMAHVLNNVVPALPQGSVVAVDDLWHCHEQVSDESISKFFGDVVANEIDYLGCFDGYYAPYWKGGFFIGFPEVVPLMEWVNHNKIDLIVEPGSKAVMFERPASSRTATVTDFNLEAFNKLTGSLHHNPVGQITVYQEQNVAAGQQAQALCRRGIELFTAGSVQEALGCFNRAVGLTSKIGGAFYAMGVCLARLGRYDAVLKALEAEISSKFAHPNARILYEDIKAYMAKEQGHISRRASQEQTPVAPNRGEGRVEGPTKKVLFTIFAMPKAFTETFAVIQKNAIGSWMQLRPCPEIILLGDDQGVAEFACANYIKHIPYVQCNEFGTPLLSDLFGKAQLEASNEICVYVNSDIILMDDFAAAIARVAARFEQFMMIGRRWDFDIRREIDFDDQDWQERLMQQVTAHGVYHAATGIDYFAFKKGLWSNMPAFALGRGMWDNWLVREALLSGWPVVDASKGVTIVHQNHDFSHVPGGKKAPRFDTEIRRNLDLAGNDTSFAYTSHATWELTADGIELRPVSEFLKEDNPSVALTCIECAYRQAPDVVREQCEQLAENVDGESARGGSRLLPAAKRALALGTATNAARLLLNSLEREDQAEAEELFRRGFQSLSAGNPAEAVAHLERAAASCATLPNLYYALATAYGQLGDVFSARRACEMELFLRPDNRGAAELLERINQAVGEYERSLTS